MSNFDFIKDQTLRSTLENSIEYIFLTKKSENKNKLHEEEANRVIILYVISIIEALLLYFYKSIKENITSSKYKILQTLPQEISYKDKKDLHIVLATIQNVDKKEYEIGVHDLVSFLRDKKKIKSDTANRILKINAIRNTFHLSKERKGNCDTKTVEESLNLLVYILGSISKILDK